VAFVWIPLKAQCRPVTSLTTPPVNLVFPHSANSLPSTPLKMIFSVAVVASVLSLLCSTRALTLPTRQNDCSFVCPGTDVDGKGLSAHTSGDTTISCSYSPESGNWCTYASVSVGPLCVSHTPAHMSWLRILALSLMGATAVLNRLHSYALTAEADN
jgi:hypothetical protein